MKFFHQPQRRVWHRTRWFTALSWPSKVALVVVVVLLLLQVERLVSHGTLLGYQVMDRSKSTQAIQTTEATKVKACTILAVEDIETAIGEQVSPPQQTLPDRDSPELVSTCTFRASGSERSVTIFIRDYSSIDQAKQTVSQTSRRPGATAVSMADEAYFVDSSRQLIARSGNRIVMVSVSQPVQGQVSSQQAAEIIMQSILDAGS